MKKIIWACWLQGVENAPPLVRACLHSWKDKNPDWDVRVLDAYTIRKYIPIDMAIDLSRQQITAASFSDILRLMLLHEYGGVWVDATTYCNVPLDDWIAPVSAEGFFAFERPAPDRPLASWFLYAAPGNTIISRWLMAVLSYWQGRTQADKYFWLHRTFQQLCDNDGDFAEAWSRVPKISADGPHLLQNLGLHSQAAQVNDLVDWSTPLFKLTYRTEQEGISPGSILAALLGDFQATPTFDAQRDGTQTASTGRFASLKVSTENVGDHIQILSCLQLLGRFDIEVTDYVDRDYELDQPRIARGDDTSTGVPIVLNGWFKHGSQGWPPSPVFDPLFAGFHIRLHQSPALVSSESLAYFRRFEPIGSRDPATRDLLTQKGVNAFVSNCLSLTFPRRIEDAAALDTVFVVSRDRRILDQLPPEKGPYTYVPHYSDTADFDENIAKASDILSGYRSKAKLIVTTLLHCALPAIAMGIPVIVIYPFNDAFGHESDVERFSALAEIVPIYSFDELSEIDWSPGFVDVAAIKLGLIDQVSEYVGRFGRHAKPIGPIADADLLPPS